MNEQNLFMSIKGIKSLNIRNVLSELYLDYFNNYATIEVMAEHQKMKVEDLKILIDLGRKINNKEYNVIC